MFATVYTTAPFDVNDKENIHVIKFRQTGDAVTNNKCVIKDKNGTVVYQKTVTSKKYQHNIDLSVSNSLQNGNDYLVYIQVSTDNGSTQSEENPTGEILFCIATPTFKLNIENNDKLASSTNEFVLTYEQEDDELLESYQIILYSSAKSEIASSGTKYVSTINPLNRFKWSYYNFETSNSYYIRAKGLTIHNMEIDTGFIYFEVYYEHPAIFSFLEATNLPNIGGIQLKTNFVEVKGTVYDINTDEKVDTDILKFRIMEDGGRALILQPNYKLVYDSEIFFEEDFSIALVYEEMYPNVPLFSLLYKDKEGNINSSYSDKLYQRIGRNGSNDWSGQFDFVDAETWTDINGETKTTKRIYSSNIRKGLTQQDFSSQGYTQADINSYLVGADECEVQNTQGNAQAGSIRNYYYVVWIKRKDNLWTVNFDLTQRKETGEIDIGTDF